MNCKHCGKEIYRDEFVFVHTDTNFHDCYVRLEGARPSAPGILHDPQSNTNIPPGRKPTLAEPDTPFE